jgi:hypothetical protein
VAERSRSRGSRAGALGCSRGCRSRSSRGSRGGGEARQWAPAPHHRQTEEVDAEVLEVVAVVESEEVELGRSWLRSYTTSGSSRRPRERAIAPATETGRG